MHVNWGDEPGERRSMSVEYMFKGESAHAAGAPWRGASALDAVELMDVGWNFRREHLRLQQRSHYVITARRRSAERRAADRGHLVLLPRDRLSAHQGAVGDRRRDGEGRHADDRHRGDVAAARLGLAGAHEQDRSPKRCTRTSQRWGCRSGRRRIRRSRKALQHELKVPEIGLRDEDPAAAAARGRFPTKSKRGGGSDDIGDISWNVPTVTLNYPANMRRAPGHNWANAVVDGDADRAQGRRLPARRSQAMTVLDLLMRPELVAQAWDYFNNVQTKDDEVHSRSSRPERQAGDLAERGDDGAGTGRRCEKYYFDPTKYKTYLEQLGISIRPCAPRRRRRSRS